MQKNNSSESPTSSSHAIKYSRRSLGVRALALSLICFALLPSCKSSQKGIQTNPASSAAITRSITDPVRAAALETILPSYTDWQTAELSGKLRLKKLPVSPTLKIYMKRAEEISISVRVTLLGEVGRLEVNKDSIFAINKMKRVYCAESIAGVKYDYPDIIADVQSLLLGRVVVLNAGELTFENSEFMDFLELNSSENVQSAAGGVQELMLPAWQLSYPKGRSETDEFSYEYRISPKGLTEKLSLLLSTADTDMAVALDYSYPGSGYDLNISYSKDNTKKFDAEVDFDAVKWGANPPSAINTNKYSKVSIKQFLKSF